MTNTAIVWIRRDFRLDDNPALHQAFLAHDNLVVLYIHAPHEDGVWAAGAASDWWLHHSLTAFDQSLRKIGGKLIIRSGNSIDCLLQMITETSATDIYWNRLYEPAAVSRDTDIKKSLVSQGLKCHSFNGALLREPWEATKDDGTMYRVYTPFSNKYFKMAGITPTVEAPAKLSSVDTAIDSIAISALCLLPKISWDKGFHDHWQPGESGALQRLEQFIDDAVADYQTDRDIPSIDGISRLSPHLHFGEISPRQIWHAVNSSASAQRQEQQVRPYLKQLIWRDFAHHLLYHLPQTPTEPFNKTFERFEWDQDDALLHKWQRGQTGIPLIDAGMRELWHTGWMHNRVRMLVASVLTKNALLHWHHGARWFWDTLVDANLANNTMGWQWTAGCGVDAAPYFRIFSPARQGARFDPQGEYVKHWVPELAKLPAKFIHEPWLAPQKILDQAGIALGKDYPEPMVDLSETRKQALARYKRMRE